MIPKGNKPSAVLLTRAEPGSCFVAHELARSNEIKLRAVITESRSRGQFTMLARKLRRAARQGLTPLLQFAIGLPYLFFYDRSAMRHLKDALFPDEPVEMPQGVPLHELANHNASEAWALLENLAPDLILVFGTRILVPETFGKARVISLNWHTGITPEYRGAKSEFWALYNGEPELVGLTLHIVDAGIDTGDPVAQHRLEVTPADDEHTLRAKAIRAAVPLLEEVVRRWRAGELPRIDTAGRRNGHYSTPSMFQYMALHRRLRTARR